MHRCNGCYLLRAVLGNRSSCLGLGLAVILTCVYIANVAGLSWLFTFLFYNRILAPCIIAGVHAVFFAGLASNILYCYTRRDLGKKFILFELALGIIVVITYGGIVVGLKQPVIGGCLIAIETVVGILGSVTLYIGGESKEEMEPLFADYEQLEEAQ